ncbi:MAG: DUF4145 domain-containing protein [Candidatus Woesearchaeota archaeon]
MIVKVTSESSGNLGTLPIRCPGCGREGSFENVVITGDLVVNNLWLGQRKCPNKNCKTHIFFIYDSQKSEVVASYPSQRIDFDVTDIPNKVVNTFEEAISCHSHQLYIASAIMVRRTIEEICEDKSSTGNNLKERIIDLGNKIVIPKEFIEGIDELRLLGNDAAHIEAKVYKDIGKTELDVAIKFAKEFLKAVYQYSSLLKELQELKNKNKGSATVT